MSYKSNPAWTRRITLPPLEQVECPSCGVASGKIEDMFQVITSESDSYYFPQHIPPRLTFLCLNEDCPDYEKDYYIELSCVVIATQPKRGLNG